MGGGTSIVYSVPVTQKPEGQTSIYRNRDTKDKLFYCPSPELNTVKAIILNSYKQFAKNPAVGKIVTKNNLSQIEYLNYKEFVEQAHQVGSGIINEKLYNTPEGEKLKFVGLFSKNRVQWGLTDIACVLFNVVTIPLYDTLGDQNITYVFQHTQLETTFVNEGSLKSLLKCKDLVKIKKIICFDPFTQEQETLFQGKGVALIPFAKIIQKGKEKPVDYNREEFNINPDDCLTFSYTSGTTGPPKGAMIAHKNITSCIAAERVNPDINLTSQDVALSYLPLPHIMEREFDYTMWSKGGRVVYFSGDVQKLKDDLAIVRPTIFQSVPRLFSRFHEAIKHKFNQLQGLTKKGVQYALSTKLENLKKTGSVTHRVFDSFFFSKTKQILGGRCRLLVSGSAPLLPDVQNFLKVVLCCPLIQGYGQTESTGALLVTNSVDPVVKRVGGPLANFEVKLVDIPEMNYLSTDKDTQGRPAPRGEIWARGPGVFLGYYHDKTKTEETITPDGWLKTGDVGEMAAESRSIAIVDRKKNIFKLQQGEYVAAEKVQNIYSKYPLLAEIFIHGESTETFVIAIVVPHRKALEELAAKKGVEGHFEELCKNDVIRTEIVIQLNKIGKDERLQGFEQAKNVYVDPLPFLNKGILTNTMKLQRFEAKKVYREIIDQLYKEGMLKVEKK